MKRWYDMVILLLVAVLMAGCQQNVPGPTDPPALPPATSPVTEPPTQPPTEPRLVGWQESGGKRYYYDENGKLFIGWLITEEATYYLNPDGAAQTGWADIGDYTYYFREDGVMHTGWLEESSSRYYFLENGAMAQGWAQIGEARYYFSGDGAMYTGWLYRGEYAYYLQENGAAAVGPLEIDGQTYHFSPSGVYIILVNPWNYIPEDYETELVTTERDLKLSIQCVDALERMFADCRAAGCSPVLLSANRTWATQERLYNNNVQKYLDWGYGYERAKELAGQSVAVPGTSEHQLGLAVDIVDNSNWSLDESQERTKTQKWMMEHCWEYGFILRYPNDTTQITGIIYEPWHYRYVGVEIALELRDLGITLEEYLGAA